MNLEEALQLLDLVTEDGRRTSSWLSEVQSKLDDVYSEIEVSQATLDHVRESIESETLMACSFAWEEMASKVQGMRAETEKLKLRAANISNRIEEFCARLRG